MSTLEVLSAIGSIASILGLVGVVYLIYDGLRVYRIKKFIIKNYAKFNYNYDLLYPEVRSKYECGNCEYTDIFEGLKYKNK